MPSDFTQKYTGNFDNGPRTIPTHVAVTVSANNTATGQFFSCENYTDMSVTLVNDAATNSAINVIWSNDGFTDHGFEVAVAASTLQRKAVSLKVKAKFCKVQLNNTDAASHVMSAWAYLTKTN